MRKFLIPTLAIALVMGLVVSGTWAFFSDAEASSGNTFTPGTLDLKLRRGPGAWSDGIATAVWSMSNMAPGVSTTSGSIELTKVGSVPADHLEITVDYSAIEGLPDGPETPDTVDTSLVPDSFARYLEITSMRYYKDGWYIDGLTGERKHKVDHHVIEGPYDYWKVEDKNDDGIISLYDLKYDPLDNLPFEGVMTLDMSLRFHESAGNDLQGDTLVVTVIFTLNEDSSQ